MVISGPIVEVYEYENEILEGFSLEKDNRSLGRSSEASPEDKELNREKVYNRAKRDLRRLINTNIQQESKFVTLTFADNIQDFETANHEFELFIKRLNYNLGHKVSYVCVPEFQKRGAIHYHLLMFNVPYIENSKLSKIWGQGFVRINSIKNVDNVGAYVCKYMSKDMNTDERLRGYKCYFSSRGLDKPTEIKEKDLVKSIADSLQGQSPVYINKFTNEHNSVSYSQYNMNNNVLQKTE